ncbi:MAG: SIS domain-containing protein [Hyphomonadaceae bacterium]
MTVDPIAIGREVLRAEAEALQQLAGRLDGAFAQAVEVLRGVRGRVVVTGMGKSGHIARKIAATFASTGRPAMFVHPGEASHGDLGMITADDCVLAISRSGETREMSDLVYHARRLGVPLVAMTFASDSTLADVADVKLILPDTGEAMDDTPAPTTSTTLCLALGDALAVAVLRANGFSTSDFRALHPGGKLGAMLSHVSDLMVKGDALPLVTVDTPFHPMVVEMSQKRLGCVGVTDASGALVGVVTDGDLRRHLTADLFTRTAGEIMTANPHTISAHATAADAVRILNELKVTVLFVLEAGKPVGAVHLHAFLAAGVR